VAVAAHGQPAGSRATLRRHQGQIEGYAMKLYSNPVSTASRPVIQFCIDANIDCEFVVVDLMKGEQRKPPFAELNPNCLVPALEDGDFVLTESSAILKYLAEKAGHPAYPKDLRARARVNELMDWFNTGFYREYGYHLIYPQLFPHHQRPSEEAQTATLNWGKDKACASLKVLNDHYLAGGRKYLCGSEPTIADYFGAAIVSLGELIGVSLKGYPNVQGWLAAMKARPSWSEANAVFDGFAASLKGRRFVSIGA
jgi:glutathione S-transferase